MKNVLLIALVLGSVSAAAAQTSNTGAGECKLKLSQAPVVRGIHLGMTVNEVLAVFPGADKNETLLRSLSEPRFGVINADVVPSYYGSKERFVGIRSVNFGFLDGELNLFAVTYNGPDWKNDEQFASKVAETLNLPGVESWKPSLGGKALACDGFEVSVQMPTENWGNTIKVRNLEKDVNRIVREREEAVKDAARRAFRP
jgi:hypothetical protein